LFQESHFVATTSRLTKNDVTDPLSKPGEQGFQIPEENLVPTINAEPDPMELKTDEDLKIPTTSSGSIEEDK
jgi:hypothetical protein